MTYCCLTCWLQLCSDKHGADSHLGRCSTTAALCPPSIMAAVMCTFPLGIGIFSVTMSSASVANGSLSNLEYGPSSVGLAHDALSTENAVAIMHAERTPLILDPSGQASLWLQARLKAKGTNYEVVQMHSDRSAAANQPACKLHACCLSLTILPKVQIFCCCLFCQPQPASVVVSDSACCDATTLKPGWCLIAVICAYSQSCLSLIGTLMVTGS